jgi:uncharacterized membrane protein
MYCRARIAGHPIHPMLVTVPIGLFVATFATLVAHAVTGDPFYHRAALIADVAGVLTALVSAIPGAIDLATLERGKVRQTGVRHALLGGALLLVYAGVAVALWRSSGGVVLPLALASVGMVALVAAAAHGYALVQTHKIGVRPTHLRSIPASRLDPARLTLKHID